MNFLKPCLAILAAGFAGSALACDYPPLVAIPDADDATMDDMVATQESVRAYMENMDAYLTCVNEELAAAGPSGSFAVFGHAGFCWGCEAARCV